MMQMKVRNPRNEESFFLGADELLMMGSNIRTQNMTHPRTFLENIKIGAGDIALNAGYRSP